MKWRVETHEGHDASSMEPTQTARMGIGGRSRSALYHVPMHESPASPKPDHTPKGVEDVPHRDASSAPPPIGTPSAWRFAAPIILVLLVLVAFLPAFSAGFVLWDDDDLLLANTRYQSIDADSLRWMFTTFLAGHYQPLTWLSYAVDYAAWGGDPRGYHLTNVLLHVLTTLAFYFVARRLIALAIQDATAFHTWRLALAASFAAAMFGVHPLRVESVAWIAERRDVLGGLFFVLSIGAYLRFACDGGKGWYVASLLACLVSLLSKASAVTLPFVLLVLDGYPLRRLWMRDDPRRLRSALIEKLPFVAIALGGGLTAIAAQHQAGAMESLGALGLGTRLAQACYGLAFYLGKTIWPTNLGPLYEMPRTGVLFGSQLWISGVAWLVLTIACVMLRRRLPGCVAALVAYAIIVAPVLGLLQSGPQFVADRYSYFSCLGLAVVAGGLLLRCRRRRRGFLASQPAQAIVALAAAAMVTTLACATYRQAGHWRSPLALWERGVAVCPDGAINHVNYADALAGAAQLEPAVEHYHRGLALSPHDVIAVSHLAQVLAKLGETDRQRLPEAAKAYRRALQLGPDRPSDRIALAQLLINTGDSLGGVVVLQDGATRESATPALLDMLADLLSTHPDDRVRNGAEAVRWAQLLCERAVQADPSALLTLATAQAEAGSYAKAVKTAEDAANLARLAGNRPLYAELQRRLAFFRTDRPYHYGD